VLDGLSANGGIPISVGQRQDSNPSLAFDGTSYLVVWQREEWKPWHDDYILVDHGIHGVLMNTKGEIVTPDKRLSADNEHCVQPIVATNGSNFLVVWKRIDDTYHKNKIFGIRINGEGQLIESTPVSISLSDEDANSPSICSNGKDYLVSWITKRYVRTGQFEGYTETTLYAAKVTEDCNVLHHLTIYQIDRDFDLNPSFAWSGERYWVVREEDHKLFARYVTVDGQVGPSWVSPWESYEVGTEECIAYQNPSVTSGRFGTVGIAYTHSSPGLGGQMRAFMKLLTEDESVVKISNVDVEEGPTGQTEAVFKVVLSKASENDIGVTYHTEDGTAVAGEDYVSVSGEVVFPSGSMEQEIRVPIIDNDTREPDETFKVILTGATNAILVSGVNNVGIGTIVDDEPLPAIRVNDVTVEEGDSGYNLVVFEITMSGNTVQEVQVGYQTNDYSAEDGKDYDGTNGTLTFAPGETAKYVAIPVYGDGLAEPNETFRLCLSDPINATLADAEGDCTILNDDGDPPSISITDVQITEPDTGSDHVTLTLTLSEPSSAAVGVDVSTRDGSATQGSDYQETSQRITFEPGSTQQTLEILIYGDVVHEGNEEFFVELKRGCNAIIAVPQAKVTIVENDPIPTISVSDASIQEGDWWWRYLVFNISLSNPSSSEVRVSYATEDVTASSVSDYLAAAGEIVFAPGTVAQQIRVKTVGDPYPEEDESLLLRLSNPVNAKLEYPTATGTIVNDDAKGFCFSLWFKKVITDEDKYIHSITAGDIDNDGDQDIIYGTFKYCILKNNGQGFDNNEITVSSETNGVQSLALADIDSDGDLDIVAGGYSHIERLLNDGSGNFEDRITLADADQYLIGGWTGVVLTDIDNDNDFDLVAANLGEMHLDVLVGDGEGNFDSPQSLSVSGCGSVGESVDIGDLNGDGDNDIAAPVSGGEKIAILLNDGNGNFDPDSEDTMICVSPGEGTGPRHIISRDLDGDGDLDLAVANGVSHDISILLNNGTSPLSFSEPIRYASGGNNPYFIVGADFDLDGDVDLAVANWMGNSISIFENMGNGRFILATTFDSEGSKPIALGAADFDGDNRVDLAVANSNGIISVFRNDVCHTVSVSFDKASSSFSEDAEQVEVVVRVTTSDGGDIKNPVIVDYRTSDITAIDGFHYIGA